MLEIYLNSPKQIELCFTLEAKQSATRSHLPSTSSSCQMKPKPQAWPFRMGTRASPTKVVHHSGGPASDQLQWDWERMRGEACISLSLRGRADSGMNKLLAEGIILRGALSFWPDVPFQEKKDGVHTCNTNLVEW